MKNINLNSMATMVVGILFSLNIQIASAGEKDNGGSLSTMQKARALAREDLEKYLTTNSRTLRGILEGLVLYIDAYRDISEPVKSIVQKMLRNEDFILIEDVRYSNYSIDLHAFQEHCGIDSKKDACTELGEPGSTIYFNLDGLLQNHVSLAELVGLTMHEHSRHYTVKTDVDAAKEDADDQHLLANFYMDAFIKNRQVGKTFTMMNGLKRMLTEGEVNSLEYVYGFEGGRNLLGFPYLEAKERFADGFCVSRSFTKALSFETSADAMPIGVFGYWNLTEEKKINKVTFSTVKPHTIFTKIVCVGEGEKTSH
jgi:hypothetical protein